jgi:uncharacterized protein (TIGR04222 family)
MSWTLITLLPMIVYALGCIAVNRGLRPYRDPLHIGYVGRILEPPDDLPPALAARLLNRGIPSNERLIVATLLDLARRGHIRLTCRPSAIDSRRTRIILTRTPREDGPLAPFEQALLDALFDEMPQVDLRAAWPEARGIKKKLAALWEHDLLERGLLDANGARRRRIHGSVSLIVAVLGLLVASATVWLSDNMRWWSWLLLGLGLLICIGIVIAEEVRGVTQRGADARAAWRGFADSLGSLDAAAPPVERFAEFLPYAVALDKLKPFMRAFERHDVVALSAAYLPLPDAHAPAQTIPLDRARPTSLTTASVSALVRQLERALQAETAATNL